MAKREELSLRIQGMHCASCVANIERGVSGLDGVSECRVNLATNSAVVEFDSGRLDADSVIHKIKSLGYGASVGQQDVLSANESELRAAKNRFLLALVLAIPLMAVAMWPMFVSRQLLPSFASTWLQALFAVVIIFVAGRGILMDAARQATHLRANMNTLIAMGAVVSFGWSLYEALTPHAGHAHALYFESAGMIVTLILLGRFLEARSK
ncbi:MAG TPA: cation transporter, partial [Candidatus Acidoferrum sp.]|nr:cation transporter [Candidatus Acidoferrum sp.]